MMALDHAISSAVLSSSDEAVVEAVAGTRDSDDGDDDNDDDTDGKDEEEEDKAVGGANGKPALAPAPTSMPARPVSIPESTKSAPVMNG